MDLFFRKVGEGDPIVFLHGVFGSSDNLYTVSKNIADAGFSVYLLDARNHGQSPRDDVFNYEVMASDLNEFLSTHNLINPIIIGHSMGGKTVLKFSQKYSNFSRLIIIDIAARFYPTHHDHILSGLMAIDLSKIESRKAAEDIFSEYVSDIGERQFILKNLYRTESGFDWRINITVISENIYLIGEKIELSQTVEKPTLILTGSESSYVSDEDFGEIKEKYPNSTWDVIEGANHWVHATQPKAFLDSILKFIRTPADKT